MGSIKKTGLRNADWDRIRLDALARGKLIRNEEYKGGVCGPYLWIWQGRGGVNAFMVVKDEYGNVRKYVTNIENDSPEIALNVNGGDAFKSLNARIDPKYKDQLHATEQPGVPHDSKFYIKAVNATGCIKYNPRFNGQRFEHCYEYDLNSAFPAAMLQDLPDMSTEMGPGIVEDDELGFRYLVGDLLDLCGDILRYPGQYADVRFKKIKSPFKRFVDYWYDLKSHPKKIDDKDHAKKILNYAIGEMTYYNSYWRVCIIERCNKFVLNLYDKYPENIYYISTDALVTNKKIPELEALLGNELGELKYEHYDEVFAYKDYAKQWGQPKIKGQPTSIVMRGVNSNQIVLDEFDILTDKLNSQINWNINKKDGSVQWQNQDHKN